MTYVAVAIVAFVSGASITFQLFMLHLANEELKKLRRSRNR